MRLDRRQVSSLALVLLLSIWRTFSDAADKRIMCYYASWSRDRDLPYRLPLNDIDSKLCTHIVYALPMPDLQSGIVPIDFLDSFVNEGGLEEIVSLKKANPDLKWILSLGGWNEGSIRFSRIAADPEKRKWFAEFSCQQIRAMGLDGLEINWQWPGIRLGSNSADKENYATFITEIKRFYTLEAKRVNKPRLLFSIVVPPLMAYISRGFIMDTIKRDADFLNVLTMEYHTSTDPLINHPAPLFTAPNLNFDIQLTVNNTVSMYLDMGVEPDKINLGIPVYGLSYVLESSIYRTPGSRADEEGVQGFATDSPGVLAYFEICRYIRDDGWLVEHPNKTAMGPYAYHDKNWVAFDDVDMVKNKVEYAVEKGLGGIMLWTIDLDDFNGSCGTKFPLTRAARQTLDLASSKAVGINTLGPGEENINDSSTGETTLKPNTASVSATVAQVLAQIPQLLTPSTSFLNQHQNSSRGIPLLLAASQPQSANPNVPQLQSANPKVPNEASGTQLQGTESNVPITMPVIKPSQTVPASLPNDPDFNASMSPSSSQHINHNQNLLHSDPRPQPQSFNDRDGQSSAQPFGPSNFFNLVYKTNQSYINKIFKIQFNNNKYYP